MQHPTVEVAVVGAEALEVLGEVHVVPHVVLVLNVAGKLTGQLVKHVRGKPTDKARVLRVGILHGALVAHFAERVDDNTQNKVEAQDGDADLKKKKGRR